MYQHRPLWNSGSRSPSYSPLWPPSCSSLQRREDLRPQGETPGLLGVPGVRTCWRTAHAVALRPSEKQQEQLLSLPS